MLAFLSPLPLPLPSKRPRIFSPPPRAALSSPPPVASTPPHAATQCGFATLLGPSNSGKSTLLNRLLGQKLAIVSPKVQTTRCRISGIFTHDETQVVFLDTPGIFEARNRLSRAMVKAAWASHANADAVAVVLDAAHMYHNARRRGLNDLAIPDDLAQLLTRVSRTKHVCICANKIDAIPEDAHSLVEHRLRAALDSLSLEHAPLIQLSARRGTGVDDLVEWVIARMPSGPWLYPEDDLTDMPSRLLAAEVVREKAFLVLRHELPYEIAVETTEYKNLADGSIRIVADILVSRNSQKRIVTGSGGAVVKEIGIRARKELANVLGDTVHLMLNVKVRGQWKEDRRQYERWGLDYNA